MNELCLGCTGYTQPNGCIGEVIDGKCKYYHGYFENDFADDIIYEQELDEEFTADNDACFEEYPKDDMIPDPRFEGCVCICDRYATCKECHLYDTCVDRDDFAIRPTQDMECPF